MSLLVQSLSRYLDVGSSHRLAMFPQKRVALSELQGTRSEEKANLIAAAAQLMSD